MLPQTPPAGARTPPHRQRPLPQLAADGQLLTQARSRRPATLAASTAGTGGIELPSSSTIPRQRQTIEDLHRQIAMLRFTLASQRRQESQGWPAALEIHSEPNEIAPADDDHQDHHDLDDQGSNNADRAAA